MVGKNDQNLRCYIQSLSIQQSPDQKDKHKKGPNY